jgi:hypothetical protein
LKWEKIRKSEKNSRNTCGKSRNNKATKKSPQSLVERAKEKALERVVERIQ